MKFNIFGIAIAGVFLYGYSPAYAQDARTKRCEVRPDCSVDVAETAICPSNATLSGGVCANGLLQGVVVGKGMAGRPSINRYEGGKVAGMYLNPVLLDPDSSGAMTFLLYEIDGNGKLTAVGEHRYICTFLPNGTIVDQGGTDRAQCQRALDWLGPSNVSAVVSKNSPNAMPVNSAVTENRSAIAQAKAAEAEEERKRQDAAEIRAALGQLAQTLSANSGNATPQPQYQSSVPAPGNTNAGSGQSATKGRYAGFVHEICLSNRRASDRPGNELNVGATFTNGCNEPIHARWCDAVSGGTCDYKGTYGYDLQPGESRTFYRNSNKTTGFLSWACKLSEGGRRIQMDSKPSCIYED